MPRMLKLPRVFSESKPPRQSTGSEKSKPRTGENIRYSTLDGYETWETGVWNRLPWLGILSLLGVLICLGFNVIILVLSDGMPTSKWQVQPSVLLAISAVISNWLLRFALAEGAAISWWVKAVRGCTVNDLHRYWSFANNVFDCIKRIRYFNLLLLASVASVIVSIDNPLFQRASTVSIESLTKNVDLFVHLAQQLPVTGLTSARPVPRPTLMTRSFQDVVQGYNTRSTMYLNVTGCDEGNCSTTVHAPGFAVTCSQDPIPQDFGPAYYGANGTIVGSEYEGEITGMTDVSRVSFSTNFTFTPNSPSPINFTAAYKDLKPCKSRLQVKRCSFQYALLNYPINIENGTVQFSRPLSDLGTSPKTVVSEYIPGIKFGSSVLGGVFLAAKDMYGSKAHIQQYNHRWRLQTSGMLAEQSVASFNQTKVCRNTWDDPTPQVISGLQEIMFRTALSVKNDSTITYMNEVGSIPIQMDQTVDAIKVNSKTVFQMDRRYLAAGAVVMIVCVMIVASTFYGWWKVGRTISMSPIEIAKAFNAPVLQGKGINSDLDEMLPVVGRRRVRYGEIRYQDGKMIYPDEPGEADGSDIQSKLQLGHLHWTSVPRGGVQYV